MKVCVRYPNEYGPDRSAKGRDHTCDRVKREI